MQVRIGTKADLDTVWALAQGVVAHMNQGGNPQWGEDYPTRDFYGRDIERGELYLAVEDRRILGVACINGEESPEYSEVPWSTGEPAFSIHRMAVAPEAQGRGMGRSFFNLAEELAVSRGIFALHVDTYSENEKMQGLLRSLGYRPVGEIRLHGRPRPFPCFEKLLEDRRTDTPHKEGTKE